MEATEITPTSKSRKKRQKRAGRSRASSRKSKLSSTRSSGKEVSGTSKRSGEEEDIHGASKETTRSSKISIPSKSKATTQTLPEQSTTVTTKEDSTQKSKSTRKTLIAAAILILLLAIIATTAFFIYKLFTKSERPMVIECKTAVCKQIQGQVEDQLDKNVHPCDDFYRHVCSKWVKNSRSTGYTQDMKDSYNDTLITALTAPRTKKLDRWGAHVMAKLYEVCHLYMTTDSGTLKDAVKQVIDLLNVNVVLNGQQHIFAFLLEMSLTKNIHSVFTVRFHRTARSYYLRFDLGYSIHSKMFGLFTDDFADTSSASPLRRNMISMVSEFLNNPQVNSNISADTLLDLDAEIHELLRAKGIVVRKTFKDLEKLTSPKTTQQIIEVVNHNAPPDFRADFSSQIHFAGLRSLLGIQYILTNKSVGLRDPYHLVNIATDLLRFTAFKDIARKEPRLYSEVCLRATRIALTNTWPFVIARLTGHLESGKAAKELGVRVRSMILATTVFQEFDQALREEGKENLRSTTLITYERAEAEKVSEHVDYTLWRPEGNRLFPVYVEAGDKEKLVLQTAYPVEWAISATKSQFRSEVKFLENERLLTVPTAFQDAPLFYSEHVSEIPHYINMATLGSWIAQEMVRALIVPLKGSEKSTSTLHESLACVKKVAALQGLQLSAVTGPSLWENRAVLWYYAFLIVYEGMKQLVISSGESETGDIWKETQRYLFIRFCMRSCTSGGNAEPPLAFRESCLVPVMSNPDFAAVFGCTERNAFRTDVCVFKHT
ncbi:uncharacterized protein LOC135400044 [Ornithodoros turicata]|uniref:uncharacterized protein LOC135400044 n=1 Tax=Ornithodoros turicata TaxID=34597 RepID=UPI0031394316